MKPRFSILTLLGITAYVAVTVAAVNTPTNQAVNAIAPYSWLGGMVILAVLAAQATSAVTVFARGCLFTSLIYFMIGWSDYLLPGPEMPHEYLWVWLQERAEATTPPAGYNKGLHMLYAGHYIWRHVFNNCLLAFGLLGGSLALWRYRRMERREQQGKSLP